MRALPRRPADIDVSVLKDGHTHTHTGHAGQKEIRLSQYSLFSGILRQHAGHRRKYF